LKKFIFVSFCLFLLLSACNLEDLIDEAQDSEITAKLKTNEVLSTARNDFAADAELSAIYGLNVNVQGQVDLLKPTQNAFVYVVQSDSEQSNEFYVPVFGSSPVKSPINFNSMISLVKDQTAKDILGNVFGLLSTVHISSSAGYDDSPAVIEKMFQRSDVSTFRSFNPVSKIDMFLIPSKSIDTTSVSNSADWIVNFYADTTSLVLWLHPGTVSGTITKISN
jgi:hypothetical protein